MATGIRNFRQTFSGTRPNRFKIIGSFPTAVTTGEGNGNGNFTQNSAANSAGAAKFDIYCKATSLPGSSIGVIPVAWQGRIVKFSGERTYADWSIQIYDSSSPGQILKQTFESWINLMNHRETHVLDYSLTSDWTVYHADVVNSVAKSSQSGFTQSHIMRHCFPIDISPIDMSYDMTDTFAEFTVTMAYDFWEPGDGSDPATQGVPPTLISL
jgi:hypothetical protein